MRRREHVWWAGGLGKAFLLAALLVMGGCGGGSGSGDPDPTDDVTEDTTEDIAEDTTPQPDVSEDTDTTPQPDVEPDVTPPPPRAEAEIGPEGGTLDLELPEGAGTIAVEIPAGALDDEVTISVTAAPADSAEQAPEGFAFASPLFVFEPAGLVFAEPITLRLPFEGSAEGMTVFWTALGSTTEFLPRPTTFEGAQAVTTTTHFSLAFVGAISVGACEDESACDEGQDCVAGRCVDRVGGDEVSLAAWLESLTLAVVTDVQLPNNGSEACCFDITGNGSLDNALGQLLSVWESLPNATPFTERLDEILRWELTQLLVGFRALPDGLTGTTDVAVFVGINDIDLDGNPDQSLDERREGLGEFRADRRTLGDNGAQLMLPGTLLAEGHFRTRAATFDAELPIYQTCSFRFHETPLRPSGARCRGEEVYPLRLFGLRVAGAIAADEGGVSSVDTDDVPGIRIGGAIQVQDVATLLNASYSDACRCAGIGEDDDMIVVSSSGTRTTMACDARFANPDISTCVSGQRQCAGIANLCNALPLLGNLADVDTDGDGVQDAFSFGVRVSLSPATFGGDRGPIQPPTEICDSGEDEDGDGRTDCDDPTCWDNTLCGGRGHTEWCNNGRDDNGNGLVDCDDPACAGNRACATTED